MKEKIVDFLADFISVFFFCIKLIVFAAVGVFPLLLGCLINPWWFIAAVFTIPLGVTAMIRM